MKSLVFESAELALDGELVALWARLYVADDLCVDIERFGNLDDLLRIFGAHVDFEAMTHVEDLVHLLRVCAALLLDGAEEGRHGEEIIFYDVEVLDEVHDLGLRAARAVNHAVDGWAHLVEKLLDDGSVGARRAEDELAGVERGALDGVGEAERAE